MKQLSVHSLSPSELSNMKVVLKIQELAVAVRSEGGLMASASSNFIGGQSLVDV